MITPEFELSQDEAYVSVKIKVPYVKISNAEMVLDENDFTFLLQPYYLKLSFKQAFVGNDKIHSAIYDHNTQFITVQLEKLNHSEVFEDLDMISKFLKPKQAKEPAQKFCFEVLDSHEFEDGEADDVAKKMEGNFFELVRVFHHVKRTNLTLEKKLICQNQWTPAWSMQKASVMDSIKDSMTCSSKEKPN